MLKPTYESIFKAGLQIFEIWNPIKRWSLSSASVIVNRPSQT